MKLNKVSESVLEKNRYENCMNLLEEPKEPITLDNFVEGEIQEGLTNDPDKHWIGMPEFKNPENKRYKSITVHFTTEEDYKRFAEMVDQNLTLRTKSIFFPKKDAIIPSEFLWVDGDKLDEK